MAFDRYERKIHNTARELLPAGFYIVRDGETRPGDLVYSWASTEWLSVDSPEWSQPCPVDVADCVAVARRPGHNFPGASVRSYRMPERYTIDKTAIATPKKALPDPAKQLALF